MFPREVKLVNSFADGKRVLEDKVKLHLFAFLSVRGADAIYADTFMHLYIYTFIHLCRHVIIAMTLVTKLRYDI